MQHLRIVDSLDPNFLRELGRHLAFVDSKIFGFQDIREV